ncbi:reverse transcriptase domain-containing protein [Tanacetum coccineum]|uniref:Reverse transcriptase domain-containing protein n=1 Tax=Tanacetum coccineum TaxID=301880 RepID=A0ABQ5HNP9_9ASTR
MDDELMWAADRVVAPTLGSVITLPETPNEFAIKSNHLTLVKGNQFDGRIKTDPHKHVHEFLRIYDMFKYRDTKNEAVRLMMFPLSLTRDAKTCRFFPPALFDRLLGEIKAFSQHEDETLTDAWLRMKEMLRKCHRHNLSKGNIIKIFYHGLSEATQEALNAAAGGIFLYKTPNQAYQLLEDKVLLKLDWAKNQKSKPIKRTVAFTDKGPKIYMLTERIYPLSAEVCNAMLNKKLQGGKEVEDFCQKLQSQPSWMLLKRPGAMVQGDEMLSRKFDALLEEGSKILHSIEGTILEEKLFAEFDEFLAITVDENSESEYDTEEPPFKRSPLTPIIRSKHLLKNLL